jgi:tRNA/rRNA methyltransferase
MIPPVFILVRPQMGENIGAAARAMLNFGLDADAGRRAARRLAEPEGGGDGLRGGAASGHAGFSRSARRLRTATSSSPPLRAGAGAGEGRRDPRARDGDGPRAGAEGKKVGVLFGPERAGLENDDIVRANAIVTVPVNPEFPSLNLAQCVLLMGYEWQRQGSTVPAVVMELARTELANREEVDRLAAHFEERLEAAGFFFPPTKVEGMKVNLRNMWGRLPLTRAEVQTFHGMLRQIAWKLKNGGE